MRDLDIRASLWRELRWAHRHEPDTIVLDELGLCQGSARVDVAVVNGFLSGYEIKSERDTLARLPAQQEIYSRALDYVTIVVSGRHAAKVAELVPAWWGVTEAVPEGEAVRLLEVRAPRLNPAVDPRALTQLLWRDEALEALEERGLAAGIRGKPRGVLWQRLAEHLSLEEIGDLVRSCLKLRSGWRSVERPR